MFLRFIIFILCSGVFFPLMAQRGVVKGRVVNVRNNEPLIGAVVQLENQAAATVTDSVGNYVIKQVKPGFYHITVSLLGYEKKRTEELQVMGNQTTFVDVAMNESEVSLAEAIVRPRTEETRAESPLSVQTLEVRQIEKSAGVNRDVSKLVQTLPGVAATAANRNDLLVRGGGPAENVFYLDGIELPVINHFTTQGAAGGAVGILNPDFVSAVDFYTGAFPANRPNALSSVMDIRMKNGSRDRLHAKLSLGASDASFTLDGPVNSRSTFIFSARQSYKQMLFKWLKLPFLPTYNDFQLKYDYRISERRNLSIIGLGSIDKVRLNTNLRANASEFSRLVLNTLPVYDQWHYTVGAVYKVLGEKHTDRWVLSRNMLDNGFYKHVGNQEQLPKIFDYQSQESENKLRFERIFWGLPFKLNVGAGVQHAHYFNRTARRRIIAGVSTLDNYESSLDFLSYTAFGQASKEWWNQQLKLSFGLSVAGNNYNTAMRNPLPQLSPRFSITYALSDRTDVSANVGRYAKLPSYTTLGYRNAEGELANRDALKYIISNHLVVGVSHRPMEGLLLVAEVFYKTYEHYPISLAEDVSLASKGAGFGAVGDEAVTASGLGRAYGVETVARWQLPQGARFSATYTLFRSEFTNRAGQYQPSSWDTRHILNVIASCPLGKNWNFAARWRWLGGAPYSPIDYALSSQKAAWDIRNMAYMDYSRFNSLRLPSAHQLDVRIDREFYFPKWVLNLYLDVQNVYKAAYPMEPIYTNLDAQGQPATEPSNPSRYVLREIPSMAGTMVPTMGLMVKF